MSRSTLPARPLGRHNPRLAWLRRVQRRQEKGLTVVDGLRLILDLAEAGASVVEVYTDAQHLETLSAAGLFQELADADRLFLLDPDTLSRIAPTVHSQGTLAVVAARPADVVPAGVVVYLDRVQDPGNVGAVVRCAAALGASAVACSAGCADPFSPRAVRASAGHSLILPVAVDVSFTDLAPSFTAPGGEVAGTTTGPGSIPIAGWRAREPLLLAFGNEGQGLSDEVVARCQTLVTVPLARPVESLNIAVTAGIVLAHLSGLVGSPILESKEGGRDDPSS